MFGFDPNLEDPQKLLSSVAPPAAVDEAKDAAHPAVAQSIGEIQQYVGGRGGPSEVETPEAKAAESAPAGPSAIQQLGTHGPAAAIAPIAQSVAEIKQTVAETEQAAPVTASAPTTAPAPAPATGHAPARGVGQLTSFWEQVAQDNAPRPQHPGHAPVTPAVANAPAAPAIEQVIVPAAPPAPAVANAPAASAVTNAPAAPAIEQASVPAAPPAPAVANAPAAPAIEQASVPAAPPVPAVANAPAHVGAPAIAPAEQSQAVPAAPPAPTHDRWAAARGYDHRHGANVAAFTAITGGACLGADGAIDPEKVAAWQESHGLNADGMIGPLTMAAARKPATPAAAEAAPIIAEVTGHANAPAGHANAPAGHANAPAGHANAPAAEVAHEPAPVEAQHGANAAPPAVDLVPKLLAQAAGLLREYATGLVDKAAAVEKFIAYDRKHHGGAPSIDVLAMIPAFLDQLLHGKPHAANDGAAPGAAANAVPPVAPAVGEPFKAVVDGGGQPCLVFASPGGVTATPDIFLFFHGYEAQYGIDDKQKDKKGTASGSDVTAEAMTHARGKNVIAILPQGVIGRNGADHKHEGGYMKGLEAGLPAFLSLVLSRVAAGLGQEALAPGHISIAGHSAGGYMGVHDAMKGAGELADHITDMTLMDSSYADAHFADASKWIFSGSSGKSLRIIGSPGQLQGKGASHHEGYFGKGALHAHAKKAGFTVEDLPAGDARENKTRTLQHSRLLKDGQVHADILILVANRSHGQIRDDVIDDDIMSIGHGVEDSDTFARGGGAEAPKTAADLDRPIKPATNVGPEDVEQHDEPVPAHQPSNGAAPEKVTAKPSSTTPKVKSDKSVYAPGGKLSKEHLHAFGLGDEEFAFKQRVYDAAVARLGDKIYGGVEKDDLIHVDGSSHSVRTDVAGPLESMLSAMRADMAAGKAVGGKDVGKATGIKVTSGYRSPETDRDLWDKYFTKYMEKTKELREATGEPLGSEAKHLMVQYIGKRKAPAGGSNHSNGIAVDLSMEMSGNVIGNNFDDQHVWKASWHYQWLLANAHSFGFKNYAAEAWHYDYKP